MPGYYVLSKNASNLFHFVLKADNHEIILTSETYNSKSGAENGIKSCQENSPNESRYKRETSKASQPYFNLTATNGQIIGTSQMYQTVSGRDNGIASCKVNGPTKVIKDLTNS